MRQIRSNEIMITQAKFDELCEAACNSVFCSVTCYEEYRIDRDKFKKELLNICIKIDGAENE